MRIFVQTTHNTKHVLLSMDIFKLFFDHDLRLDKLEKRSANKTQKEIEAGLADFMKPIPTYSKFYLTGTRLDREEFGLNVLEQWEQVLEKIGKAFEDRHFIISNRSYPSFREALNQAKTGNAILISKNNRSEIDTSTLHVDTESNVGHFKEELAEVLQQDHQVIYKEQAHDGFDLHLFSQKNIYEQLFHAFKPLVGPAFRFFSINSKRMGSERHFYFETWTLDKPPHGAEEVLPKTVL